MNDVVDRLRPVSVVRTILFFVGIGTCAVSQWHIFHRTEWYWSSFGLPIGALLAACALGRPERWSAPEARPCAATTPTRNRVVPGLVSLVGLLAAIYGSWVLSTAWRSDFELGFVLLVSGALVFSFALARLDGPFRKQADFPRWNRWEALAFVSILAFGLFLRFYRYDFPPFDGICAIEEPQSGQGALAIRHGDRPWEFLLDRWVGLIFMNWCGDTLTAIRIPFTILSWATLIPFYLLLREMVSRHAALLATLFFAFCRWHLVYARSAHNIFGPTLPLILLAMYLAVRVYRRGGLAPYPWIGLICGYTLYTYAGYRGTTAFIGLFFVISLLHHAWVYRHAVVPSQILAVRASLRNQALGLLLAGLGFGLIVVPLYFQLTKNPAYFLEAVERATNNPQYYHHDTARMLQQRIERIRDTVMMFNHAGDGSAVFNMPGAPQIDPVSGALLVLGLAYCIVWGGFRMQGFFAAYFLILLAFGTVFVHNFDIRRLQGVIPLIFILVAFFFDGAGSFLRRLCGRYAWAVASVVALSLSGIAFADNYRIYFKEMMHSDVVQTAFHTQYTIAIRYLHDMPADGYLLLVSDMDNFFMSSDYEWWRGDRIPGRTSHDLWPLFSGQEGPWRGKELHVLMQEPSFEAGELGELIQRRFPDAKCQPWRHPSGPTFVTFVACVVPSDPDGVTFTGGAQATYFRGTSPTPLLSRREPVISFGFLPDACHYPSVRFVEPCRGEWDGIWYITEPGDYQVLATVRQGTARIWIDGKELRGPEGSSQGDSGAIHSAVSLTAGPHRVRVEANLSSLEGAGVRLQARSAGESRWELIEFGDVGARLPPDQAAAVAPLDLPPAVEPEASPEGK